MAMKKKTGATLKATPQQREPFDWATMTKYGVVLFTMIMVVSGIAYIQQTDSLPVKQVTIEGQFEHFSKNELVEAVTPFVSGSFINVDVAQIRAAGEALPWVSKLQVRRIWPDTLHLIVKEQQAVARWNTDGLVNVNGDVFKPAKNSFPEHLVQLNGPDGTSLLMAQHLQQINQQVKKLGLSVARLDMDKRRAWNIHFKNGFQLDLGRAETKQRLERFVTVFNGQLGRYQDDIERVDMRYTNGLAVQWKFGKEPDFSETA